MNSVSNMQQQELQSIYILYTVRRLSLMALKSYALSLIIIFLLASNTGHAQCNLSGTAPTDIYYPNSTTDVSTTGGIQYLCDPNTVVYDTVNLGCLVVFMENNTTLYLKSNCSAQHAIWAKSSCTVNILSGTTPAIGIGFETGATINNFGGAVTSTMQCSSIVFPNINCANGISELTQKEKPFVISPSVTDGGFTIESFIPEPIDVTILNEQSQTVFVTSQHSRKEHYFLNVPNGVYCVLIASKRQYYATKLLIAH